MLTAIDTNVISSLWSQEPASAGVSATLSRCRNEGGLVIAAPVYAELLAYPNATKTFLNTFLATTDIRVHFNLEERVWQEAGAAFAPYTSRRRQTKAGEPKRLLVDFVVGAHALLTADRLLSLDKNCYSSSFPSLTLI